MGRKGKLPPPVLRILKRYQPGPDYLGKISGYHFLVELDSESGPFFCQEDDECGQRLLRFREACAWYPQSIPILFRNLLSRIIYECSLFFVYLFIWRFGNHVLQSIGTISDSVLKCHFQQYTRDHIVN